MARLIVAMPNIFRSDVAPPGIEENYYFKVAGGVEADGSMNVAGQAALDVWACLLARCTLWTATLSGSYTDTDWTATFGGVVDLTAGIHGGGTRTMSPYPGQIGYTAHPEVTTATGIFLDVANGVEAGIGSWTHPSLGPGSGTWTMDVFADFRVNGTLGVPWNGPLIVGSDLYIPFNLYIDANSGFGAGFSWWTVPDPGASPVSIGNVTITIPNWRAGGTISLVMPLYGVPEAFAGTAAVNLTMTPASGSYFLYGSGDDNSSPRWNADGSVNGTPGE